MMLKLLATLGALAIIAEVWPAQGPPSEFRNPQDTQPQPGPGPVIVEKRCSNCNRVVSSSSKPGDTCPFCGTKWASDEGSQAKSKAMGSAKSATIPSEAPPSIDKTIGRYAIVIAGLAVSALVVTLTVRFLMNNIWHNI
jgi:hypothetical protein